MKTLLTAIFLFASTFSAFAESPVTIGDNESRTLSKFSGVVCIGSIDVNIILDKNFKASVSANAVVIPEVETTVEDGILYIKMKNSKMQDIGKIQVDVYTSELNMVKIQGSGNINCNEAIKASSLSLIIQGSGDINMSVDAQKVSGKIEGSGNITLNGNAMNSDFSIEGSGNINALELASSNSDVSIAGSGNCNVNVSGNLNAVVKGSGNVMYTGGAKVKATSHGSGKIKSL